MERKGSTSRSPSLSRRPSFKEKKGVTLIAKKKKGPSGKKERWLLTRKTWRYMTDAVGNLLPEYKTSSNNAATVGGGSGSGSTSRRGSGFQAQGPSGSGVRSTVSPPGQLQPHQLQQWTIQQQQWVQQHTSSTSSTTFSTGTIPSVSTASSSQQQQPKSKPTSPTSSTFPPWGSFPSHRPGVTPTGPGPGHVAHHKMGQMFGGGLVNKYINPAVDPENIPQVEQHFQDVCTKEKKFLLWTRNKPKALSGPALREQKLKEAEEAASAPKKLLSPDYFSPDDFGDEEDEEDYDEYGVEDEDQITVRERRKSSTASSTISIVGYPGSSFFRPLSSSGGHGQGQAQNHSSHSDTSYSMVGGPGEIQRVVRHTGIQTDPFPEELLIRLRLQAVHDERQKQIQAMQIQLQRQHQHQHGHHGHGQGHGHVHGHGLGQGGDDYGGSGGIYGDGTGQMTGFGMGMGPLYGGPMETVGGSGRSNLSSGGHGQGQGMTGTAGASSTGFGANLRSVCLSSGTSGGVKETVIPISTRAVTSTISGEQGPHSGGGAHGLRSRSESGRESEEKVLDKSGSGASGGSGTGGAVIDATDKKSEESGYSSSISDTVLKYLRIMRKNSKADNKETIDKFKTVNYDRSLRYIKSKNVTVEEALEHEKNKALGLSGGGKGVEESVANEVTAQQGQGQPQGQGHSATAVSGKQTSSSGGGISSVTSTTTGEKAAKSGTGKQSKAKSKSQSQSQLSPTTSSPPLPGQGQCEGQGYSGVDSPPCTSPTSSHLGSSPQSNLELEVGVEMSPTSTTPSDKKKVTVKKGVKKVAKGKGGTPSKSGSGKVATNSCTDSLVEMKEGQVAGVSTSPISPTPPSSIVSGSCKLTAATAGQIENAQFLANSSDISNMPTSMIAASSPAQGGLRVTSPPKEVGIQAGESLIKYLRKLSDFSSVASASDSPAEFASLSPRLSIATSEGAEWYLHHAAYHAQHSTTSSGIPTTTRSSFDAFDLYSVGGGDSSVSTSEWEDAWVQQLLQYQQLFQQQQQSQLPQQESMLLSPPQPQGKGGLSPIPASTTGSSGSSGSGSGGAASSYSPRSQHHQLNVKISGSPLLSGSTPSTPGGGSGSSIMSSHGGHGSGGIMKSFFSSSPFASSFGFRNSSTKKPSSTSSLAIHPAGVSTSSNSGGLGRGGLLGLPPTTSSSPNLLSLVHSMSGSGSHSHSHHHQPQHGSAGGHSGHGLFRSSDRDRDLGSLGLGLGSLGSGWGGGMLSRVGTRSGVSGGGVTSSEGTGFGSKVPQKEQMSLPLVDSNLVSSNPVMQKSKSSSSVGGGGGGERGTTGSMTGTAASGGVGGASRGLMSKSSRIFKSRSKSTTRANTSSSGSAPCSWAPQGKCRWRSPNGKTITLEATNVLSLSEVERATLVEVALEKLKALSLGVEIKLPKEKSGSGGVTKKRRPYLLKKKALSTGFFEGGKRDEKESGGGSGVVFGISLSQCVANDRVRQGQEQGQSQGSTSTSTSSQQTQIAASVPSTAYYRKRSQNGSRNSMAEVQAAQQRHDDKGSTESLFWGKRGSVTTVDPIPAAVGPSLDLLQPPPPSVPAIVTACVEHLENYGLHTTGIFRVSTSLKRIRQLREEIDGGKEIQFGEEHSPHDVAALLKEFLRDLPDPLLSRELYQPFLKTQKIRNRKQQLEAVQHLVQLLPVANRDTLSSLLAFFAKVVANAGETRSSGGELLPGNKMEGYSLATLIAPNILPCMEGGGTAGGDHTLTKERRESIDVVNYMISNYTQLFEVTPELLHDVYLHLMDTQPEAVEGILKIKSGFVDDLNDEMETSSVFEGSECGDLPEGEEVPPPQQRVFRKREDILHEGAAHGGPISGHSYSHPPETSRLRGSDRVRGRREGSRERGVTTCSDAEKGGQSGAESDSSSTKSSSRWFRRTRPDKTRTSSDSGSEKVKCFTGSSSISHHHHHHHKGGGLESKRANSLDSVNVKEANIHGGGVGNGGGGQGSGGTGSNTREKSNSDQSLKVPENLNRRQSSPVLESAGVITASLKIPVPVPLNIDDTDIPFIEEDHHSHYSPRQAYQLQHSTAPQPQPRTRGRSASTDSSAVVRSPQSSHTTTPISSPGRQPSSEVSSPLGFSPPGSPPYDPRTFPYEEMTARILLGGSDAVTASTSTSTTVTTSLDKTPAKVVTSLYLQPAANSPTSNLNQMVISAPASPQPQPQTATASVYIPGVLTDPKALGNKGSASAGSSSIGGLIKSKTADFEKLANAKSTTSPSTSTSTSTYSIAPKMRLRSQENIVLKQQFLLRQQQLQQQHPHYAHPSQEEGRKHSSASPTPSPTLRDAPGHQEGGGQTRQHVRTPSAKETIPHCESSSISISTSPASKSSGPRPVTRRRQPLAGSASSSAIIVPSSHSPTTGSHSSTSTPVSGTEHRLHLVKSPPTTESESQPRPQPSVPPPTVVGGGSPSRWKRSEIIASRHDDQIPSPSPVRSRGPPPETFL